jgi:formate/nitrite transporter FocA (FNT family)
MTNVTITEHSRQSCTVSAVVYRQNVQGSTWCKTNVVFSTKARQQHNSMLCRSVINIIQYTIKHILVLVSLRFINCTFFLNVYIYTEILVRQIIDKMWYSSQWHLLVLQLKTTLSEKITAYSFRAFELFWRNTIPHRVYLKYFDKLKE